MKRISNSRNETSDKDSDDGNKRNEKKSRRRLQSLEDSASNSEPVINSSTIDEFQSDDAKNESYASLLTRHQDNQHAIEDLDENVILPEYVKVHTNTLTFPEKVSFTFSFPGFIFPRLSFSFFIAYDSTHSCRKGMYKSK